MLNKQIKFDSEARASIKNGMDKFSGKRLIKINMYV